MGRLHAAHARRPTHPACRALPPPPNRPPASPAGSFAWVPGSTGCLVCARGVPTCVAGSDRGAACGGSAAASPAHSVLGLTGLPGCGLTGQYAVPLYDTCASWGQAESATPSLRLSVYTAGVSAAAGWARAGLSAHAALHSAWLVCWLRTAAGSWCHVDALKRPCRPCRTAPWRSAPSATPPAPSPATAATGRLTARLAGRCWGLAAQPTPLRRSWHEQRHALHSARTASQLAACSDASWRACRFPTPPPLTLACPPCSYASLTIQAYYQSTTTIRTLLPAAGDADGSSAYQAALDVWNGTARQLALRLFAATSTPAAAAAVAATAVCSTLPVLQGGYVGGILESASCAPGTYPDAGTRCPPW